MASTKQMTAQRRALRWAQSSLCAGCGGHIPSAKRVRAHHPDYPTFDHVLARSSGGMRTLANGLLKHRRCNQARGNGPATGCDLIWLAAVSARLGKRPKSLKLVFKGGAVNTGLHKQIHF